MFVELNQISLGRARLPGNRDLNAITAINLTCQKFQNCLTLFLPIPLGFCALLLAKLREDGQCLSRGSPRSRS